jgi:hypothetical protein
VGARRRRRQLTVQWRRRPPQLEKTIDLQASRYQDSSSGRNSFCIHVLTYPVVCLAGMYSREGREGREEGSEEVGWLTHLQFPMGDFHFDDLHQSQTSDVHQLRTSISSGNPSPLNVYQLRTPVSQAYGRLLPRDNSYRDGLATRSEFWVIWFQESGPTIAARNCVTKGCSN